MKTVILQGDGMAGRAVEGLDGKTPLQIASTPALDYLASNGEYGRFKLQGDYFPMTGDRLHLALLGYDPRKYYTGPGVFAGAGLEVVLGTHDVAYMCNLVTLGSAGGRGEIKKLNAQVVMEDDTAGGIETEEARELIDAINEQLGSEAIQFYAGAGHRHLMVWVNGTAKVTCFDPHMVVGKEVGSFLPSGERAEILKELLEASRVVLRHHPLNQDREDNRLKPANGIWLWGPGKSIELPNFSERHGMAGVVVSESDLHRGIGICAGLHAVNPIKDGEWGSHPFDQFAEATVHLLPKYDFVYLHLQEEPQLTNSYTQDKILRLEEFDQKVVSRLLKELPALGPFRLLVTCNHWWTEVAEAANVLTPWVYLEQNRQKQAGKTAEFNEVQVQGEGTGGGKDPSRFIERLLDKH